MSRRWLPGRDPHAVRHVAADGSARVASPRHVGVVGGGIAGLAAATALAERGVRVTVLESEPGLGGRVRAWRTQDGRTMSRGFHAFFRQYYNLRALLRRTDPALERLVAVPDYPLVRRDGLRDSFAAIPRTPPWNLAGFVLRSPTFPLSALPQVDVAAALELLQVSYPASFSRYDGQSAQDFLDRLRFPDGARHLALEVFARSFFAHPSDFAAGELVAMFHTYFTGSGEGLLFDVPDDDYDTALWAPLGRYLHRLGTEVRTSTPVRSIGLTDRVEIGLDDGELTCDAVVLAADPRTTRSLAGAADGVDPQWAAQVETGRNAPAFAVLRLWFDRPVRPDREAFLGTSGWSLLDNVTVLERFEAGAAAWAHDHGGSVVELHAYALDASLPTPQVRRRLREELSEVYPETAEFAVLHEEFVVRDDCALVGTTPWADRPGVGTPDPRVVLAGDAVRCEFPVALMERAATTGFQAANALLAGWGVAGHDLWSPPMTGLLRRHRAPHPFDAFATARTRVPTSPSRR